ncbi:MAG: S1 RNA-binding domain-containing protein [Candidatus Melainabacteria bacterium]|nr:S1 RNA-binding domain-containing protein [Candidatus Melainabacteria bacterium]
MSIKIGTTHSGTVARKEEYGVFVSIKGLTQEGLVHVSRLRGNTQELRRERLKSIEVGSEMIVDVSDIQRQGRRTKIALSEKLVHDDLVLHHIPLNESITGTVTKKADFGVFVFIPDWFVTGLLHVSRMPGDTRHARNKHLDETTIGEKIAVFVVDVELKDDFLRLTLSEVEPQIEE